MTRKNYHDLYSWSHGLSLPNTHAHAIMHTDGALSVAFVWDGLSTELNAPNRVTALFNSYYNALGSLDSTLNIYIENHHLRSYNSDLADSYLQYGQEKSVRNTSFSNLIRQAQAQHVSGFSMENKILTIITMASRFSPISGLFPKSANKKNKFRAEQLYKIAANYASQLNGAHFLTIDEFEHEIWAHYHRDLDRSKSLPDRNARFKLCHRIAKKPKFDNGHLKLGKTYTKVILVMDYPDADLNWFYNLARMDGGEIHTTQIISPIDMQNEMRRSATASERSTESASTLGGESEQGKVSDHNNFRQYVTENDLALFENTYIIKLHHTDPLILDDLYRELKSRLGNNTLISEDSPEVSYLYWRVSQLGQGHNTPYKRPDHTWQVANMAPIITFKKGDAEHPQMLRITSDSQAVALSYPKDGTNHAITAAKTGSGKGVSTATQICELFPLGVNFYIAEVGASYKWVVEAFGGDYFHLDPNTTVISPFPQYKLAERSAKTGLLTLDADIVAPTVGALMPLLQRKGEEANNPHISSVAEQLMQAMYALNEGESANSAPSLKLFHSISVDAKSDFTGIQKQACQTITENLDSFLMSTAGQNFDKSDTLDFSNGIVGVDFKRLMNSPDMAKFMLVFISLRFKQLAFASSDRCRIIIDEQHEFSRIDQELITTLTKQLTRMGRKEAGAYHGISQEVMDMGHEPGILNQITHREFMYLQHGHQDIGKLFSLNQNALDRWHHYKDPESTGKSMNYRQCLKMVGSDCYDLHLTFPQILLDLADSNPESLILKEKIGQLTQDPIERLRLFREEKSRA